MSRSRGDVLGGPAPSALVTPHFVPSNLLPPVPIIRAFTPFSYYTERWLQNRVTIRRYSGVPNQ